VQVAQQSGQFGATGDFEQFLAGFAGKWSNIKIMY